MTQSVAFYTLDSGPDYEPLCDTCSRRAASLFPGRPQYRVRDRERTELTCHSCRKTYLIDRRPHS